MYAIVYGITIPMGMHEMCFDYGQCHAKLHCLLCHHAQCSAQFATSSPCYQVMDVKKVFADRGGVCRLT